MHTLLVADVGGTNARFALARVNALGPRLSHLEAYPTAQFEGFEDCLRHYLAEQDLPPALDACFAIAGPVVDNTVSMTNLPWQVDGKSLSGSPGLARVHLVNDFVAMACATQFAEHVGLAEVKAGHLQPHQPHLVIGPGTGLGVAGLVAVDGRWLAVPGEGGHFGCPAYAAMPAEVWEALWREVPHPVIEQVLSGRGLATLYRAVVRAHGGKPEALAPSEITHRARAASDRHCARAVDYFLAVLGCVARDYALVFSAAGGVFLAGGILPRLAESLRVSRFVECFVDHPFHREMLEVIPVHLLREPQAALLGAARWYLDWGVRERAGSPRPS